MLSLKNVDHIDQFKSLGYDTKKCIIGASGTLALYGIRKNKDLDILVTEDIWKLLEDDPRLILKPLRHDKCYETPDTNVSFFRDDWPLKYTIEYLLKNKSVNVSGIYFSNLGHCLEYKTKFGRPKDLEDIKLIKKFLETRKGYGVIQDSMKMWSN